jgi:RHS repeat-associated protein
VQGDQVFYGAGSGTFTVTVQAGDPSPPSAQAAGLSTVSFPETVSAGAVYSQSGAYSATVAHTYAFTAVETASGVYTATAADRAGNGATAYYTVTRDVLAPAAAITVPQRATAGEISISWLATDAGSGVQHYDLAYQVDDGGWVAWYTATIETQATFTTALSHRYAFRVRATDNVSNTSEWVEAGTTTVMARKYYYAAGQRVAMRSNGVLYYLHADHLGSTSLTTDSSGDVVAEQRYLPYGETRWVTGTLPTDFTFTGQRADSYTQLVEMGVRWYSPRLGRWTSPDSIIPDPANPQSLNRYAYAGNRPLVYVDRDGHHPLPFIILLLAAVALLPGDTGPYDVPEASQTIGDILFSIVSDPYDMASTAARCANGDCNWLDYALMLAPLLPGILGKLDEVGGEALALYRSAAIRHADDWVVKYGVKASFDVAQAAARTGDDVLPGLFRYTDTAFGNITGYQKHHLWPEALGGPKDGWAVYVKFEPVNLHTATGGLQSWVDHMLMAHTGLNMREMRVWAKQNPSQLLAELREIYLDLGIDFPY